jgi:valyl-tRNA synthetase
MPPEIPKAYEPREIEERWARSWFDEKLFRAEAKPGDKIFSIALPPPNVTGSIHIGHMLEHTQIDILVRWHRMLGDQTLWLPGMDHAGIGTQFVVERELAKQGLTRQQLGREAFEKRVWEWKAESGGKIKQQMIRLGASCDWTREKFTLEPALYRSVLEAFLRLYHEGLIYRGRYIVNWCPRCQTAISDLETKHEERGGKLWYVRYPLAGTGEYITVATTRPETMLGDVAIAVHPEDGRYARWVGKNVVLPLMNREIPVIADGYVEREFGTGALKITPGHDPNDFEVGKRHKLVPIDIFTEDAHINGNGGAYAGLDRYAAREKIVADLAELGLLDRVENYPHAVGTCDRCGSEIEPRISAQWFCSMKSMAARGTTAVREEWIRVVPENQRKILLDWFENIRDWCISRQLWWGHRIPIWHCGACGAMLPATDSRVEMVNGHARAASVPKQCSACGSEKLTQDPDVLDTWFSSWLWPFSTLGWPDDTPDLRTYYPTSLLISGYDILFFWDSRMIMAGLHLTMNLPLSERVPFRNLYLHAIVRDPHGIKMSKTRGNVVDPLAVIEKHGTDALRFTLAILAAPGTDIALSEERILSYRAFANKIWNAARFLFFNLEKAEASGLTLDDIAAPEIRAGAPYPRHGEIGLADAWIFSRFSAVVAQVNSALADYRFHEAAHVIYHFFWGDFCDWYIEWVKLDIADSDRDLAQAAWRNIFAVYDAALRLLHPFMPFLTEELWHRLPQPSGAKSIALDRYPEARSDWRNEKAERDMQYLQAGIEAVRNQRAERKIDPKAKVPGTVAIADADARRLVEANRLPLMRLASLSDLTITAGETPTDSASGTATAVLDIRIVHDSATDHAAETARLRKELERIAKDIQSKTAQLTNEEFLSRAPAKVVADIRQKLEDRTAEEVKLTERLSQLG